MLGRLAARLRDSFFYDSPPSQVSLERRQRDRAWLERYPESLREEQAHREATHQAEIYALKHFHPHSRLDGRTTFPERWQAWDRRTGLTGCLWEHRHTIELPNRKPGEWALTLIIPRLGSVVARACFRDRPQTGYIGRSGNLFYRITRVLSLDPEDKSAVAKAEVIDPRQWLRPEEIRALGWDKSKNFGTR